MDIEDVCVPLDHTGFPVGVVSVSAYAVCVASSAVSHGGTIHAKDGAARTPKAGEFWRSTRRPVGALVEERRCGSRSEANISTAPLSAESIGLDFGF